MLPKKKTKSLGTPKQLHLYQVDRQIEYDGVEMGVLENGMPYLTERGLTRMCGLTKSALNEMSLNWEIEKNRPRGKEIVKILEERGYTEETLYLKSELNGKEINAYTEPVCLAILEYYAFVADSPRKEAITAFRSLARTSFRAFIYGAVGYAPEQRIIDGWRHYHDRVDMVASAVPPGFFGIFHEIAIMIVPMIRSGIIVSDNVVPDISVGKAWSAFWTDKNLNEKFGDRIRYDHEYPPYYPQAKSNPQPSYAYPEAALGVFREWLRENYITVNFPKYILSKAKQGAIQPSTAQQVIETFIPKKLH